MKNFNQFLTEAINISGDFNGNLYINSQPEQSQSVGESYVADVVWNGSIYRLDLVSNSGIPSKPELAEQLQGEYPGAIVQQIYPSTPKSQNITKVNRYHPAKLEWI